jgi:replication factor C subunit 2/4
MQWVEKYRPNSLDQISTQDSIIESLRNGIKTKNIPHLVFYGGPGCGKTSTILALSKELFGQKNYSKRIIELNASDERGINVVRDKIKMYAKLAVKQDDNIPPWKIIILDEADTMTSDSQFALRRIIEEYSKVTRFCFICNYHNKIIDPIISRCSIFCFKPILDSDIYNKLKLISEKENFNYSDILLNKIIKIARGDLRKAINLLQKCYNLHNEIDTNEILEEVSGIIPEIQFNNLIKNINDKNFVNINKIIENITLNGYSLVNQIILFHDYIINVDLSNEQKSKIIIKLTDIDQNLIKGCDEFIQFIRLAYYIVNIISNNN